MKQQLTVEPAIAFAVYNKATDKERALLDSIFGKGILNQKIMDKVKSFEDACQLLGQDCKDPDILSGSKDEIAYKKLKIIIQALNEGWTPQWTNDDQRKYWPWFRYGGSGFSFSRVGVDCTVSGLGSRLCFRSSELAEYAAKQFIQIYNDFLL